MKDVRGQEIKPGDVVHITSGEVDILATAVCTRGRGIKFITDDEKQYSKAEIESLEKPIIVIQGRPENTPAKNSQDNSEINKELEAISYLRTHGWTGVLSKEVNGLKYTVNISTRV